MHTNCNKKTKNESLFCHEHTKRIFYDKLSLEVNYKKLDLEIFNYNSNASIILCPEHIGHQWYTEYSNKFGGKRVIMILTRQQYSNLLISDILLADIIIISYKMMNIVSNHGLDPVNYKNRLESSCISLFDFKFKRIFLDEIHQLNPYEYALVKQLINKCTFCWNISGTPFIKGYTGLIEILKLNTNIDLLPDLNKIAIDKCVTNTFNLFRKNTPESIKYNDTHDYLNNNITYDLQLLTFTNDERIIYDGKIISGTSKYDEAIIKLCCDPELYNRTRNLIRQCSSFQEIKDI
jgi:hypothetical protein